MSTNLIEDIIDFQALFSQHYNGPPRELPTELRFVRKKRLTAEYIEYNNAFFAKNHAEQLDGLVDLVYVAIGTALLHGWDFQEAWNRVHAANMTKIRKGVDIVKPEGFVHPDLSDLTLPMQIETDPEF